MLANFIIGAGIAVLFILAVRHIIRQHREGGCCGSCKGCHGCDHPHDKGKAAPEE